jgi:hypothetical protein
MQACYFEGRDFCRRVVTEAAVILILFDQQAKELGLPCTRV